MLPSDECKPIIRRLSPRDDLAAVAHVYVASWRVAYAGLVPQDYLDSLTEGVWMESLARRVNRTWVACEDGAVIGVCSYGSARDEERAGWGEVVSLYVQPGRWGAGVGSRLLHAALDSLRAEGFAQAYLWVLEDNARARAFYERQGFGLDECGQSVEIGGVALREVCYVATFAEEESDERG